MQESNIAPGILAVDEEDGGADDIKKCPFAMLGCPNPHKMSIPSKEASSSGDKDHDLNSDIDNGAGKVHQMSVETKKMNTVSAASQGNNTAAAENKINKTRCPWPFVFFHDFDAGIRDWHTWAVVGLTLCYGLSYWLDLH